MSEEANVEYRGQCDAWWDAHGCQLIEWPKGVTGGLPQHIFMRCVMEAGHDPLPGSPTGHNFGGLGPYTPGMPGWAAQQAAIVPEGASEWQRQAWEKLPEVLDSLGVEPWAPVPRPICVEWERHYPGRTTCNHCMPYWSAMAERHAPREACGSVHAHEAHVWWPWAEIRAERWCLGVEQCPPSDAGRVALTMTVDAGRMFWQALIYAAARVSPDARVAGAEQSHEEWLQWGASRLDAAIRAADAGEAGQP